MGLGFEWELMHTLHLWNGLLNLLLVRRGNL